MPDIDSAYFMVPRKIDYNASMGLTEGIAVELVKTVKSLKEEGWTFYAVNSRRGRCAYASKTITIPVFALVKGVTYRQWYIAHECAHAIVGGKENHGPVFMQALRRICPEDSIHFELGYKPRNAASAGILSCTDF